MKVKKGEKIPLFFAALIMQTASFDIVFSLEIKGFSFRCSQFLAIGLYIPALWKVWKSRKIQKMCAGIPLGICFFSLVAATFHSEWYIKNIAYDCWMLSLIMIVWSFVQLFTNEDMMKWLIKVYLIVFDTMAIFGLIQFLLAFLGISELFLRQWLIYGVIPRINGFTYEPSYYATYMVMGWALCAGLIKEKIYQWNGISIRVSYILISLSLVFSSSRMVYICFISWTIFYIIIWIVERFCEKDITKDSLKALLSQLSIWGIVLLYILFVAAASNREPVMNRENQIGRREPQTTVRDIMMQGVDADRGAENLNERLLAWRYTFDVFTRSPLWGCGLGAVTDEARAFAFPKNNPLGSGNVFLEILAAGGFIAGTAAIIYVVCLLRPGWRRKGFHMQEASVSRALGYGLVGSLILLMCNATILRVYLWVHIALLTSWNGLICQEKQ